MNETVIFALLKGESVLCEKREYLGNIENCILGGSVETIDRASGDYIQSVVMREAREENKLPRLALIALKKSEDKIL